MLVSSFTSPSVRMHCRKYSLNESYFDVLNEENAYWLGYLSADGCVSVRTRNGTRQFVLSASSIDVEHLDKLRNALDANHPLHRGTGRVKYLMVTSYRLCLALEKHGVVPRKSLSMKPPKLPDALFWPWLRGLIDGDGCFNRYYRPNRARKCNGIGRPATNGRYVLQLKVVGSLETASYLQSKLAGGLHAKGSVWVWSINDERAVAILRSAYRNSMESTRLDRKYVTAARLGIVET